MFETLTKGFRAARQRLAGQTELTEDNIESALRDVRLSLLEADVEFNVVKRFLQTVKEKAIGEVMQTAAVVKGQKVKASPADRFIKICHDELIAMMSSEGEPLTFAPKPAITGILMVGLQGTGKTTQTGKSPKTGKATKTTKSLVAAATVVLGVTLAVALPVLSAGGIALFTYAPWIALEVANTHDAPRPAPNTSSNLHSASE